MTQFSRRTVTILTFICGLIACLPLSLAVGVISDPTNSNAVGRAGFTELSIFRNGPRSCDLDHTVVITDASAPVYGDDDSDADKNEKDEKDEDQGQIRLWDSVLLG